MSKHIGSTLDSLLEELGEKDEVELLANKKIVADTLQQRMKALKMTTGQLADRMNTSRNQVHRLLDPQETGVTFKSIDRASRALGLKFGVTLAPQRSTSRMLRGSVRSHGSIKPQSVPARRTQAKR